MAATFLEGRYDIVPPGHPSNQYDYGKNAYGYKIAEHQHHWHSCRDKVQGVNPDLLRAGFIFTHDVGKGPGIAAFLNKVEEILDLPERTVFRETDLPKALWMKLAPFWVTSFMRRSFLTMALRCGAAYRPLEDNFDVAFQSITYAKETQPAIKRFLAGFTHYTGIVTTDMTQGWHRVFLSQNADFARLYLKAGHELTSRRAFLKYQSRVKNGVPGDAETDWKEASAELARE